MGNDLLTPVPNRFYGALPPGSVAGGPTILKDRLLMPYPQQRAGMELAFADGVSLRRRTRHQRILCAGSGLYRGTCAGQLARPAGGRISIQVVFGILVAYTSDYLIRMMHLAAVEWR